MYIYTVGCCASISLQGRKGFARTQRVSYTKFMLNGNVEFGTLDSLFCGPFT